MRRVAARTCPPGLSRNGTNTMYLFMMAAALNIVKDIAIQLAHHTIECFAELIKEKNIACSLLNEINPLLLEHDDYESVNYLVSSSLGLAPSTTQYKVPVSLAAYLPLLPLCLKKVIDKLKGNDKVINSIIDSHIEEALLIFNGDKNLATIKDIINGIDANFADLDDDTVKISARVHSFEQLDVLASINVIIIVSEIFQVHKYYGSGLLRQYVYLHSRYVISKFAANYRNQYKNPLAELENVQQSSIDDLSASKKMIRLLVAFSKQEVPLTPEQEQFIEI